MWFRRGFLVLLVHGMDCVILFGHSLDLPYNYLGLSPRYACFVFEFIDGVVDSSSSVTSLPYVCGDVTVPHSFKLKILQAENGDSRRVAIAVLPRVSCLNKVAVCHKFCIHIELIETSPFQKFTGKCRSTGDLTRISPKIDSTRQSSPAY